MNILYVGPYRQQSNTGLASQSYIKSLLSNPDNNITTRPIFLQGTLGEIDPQILSCEQSLYESYDVSIQHNSPQAIFYDGRFKKNIAILFLETNDISHSESIFNINKMDEVWVSSDQEKKCLLKSGIHKPISVISQALDTEFIKTNIDHKLHLHHLVDATFKFYCIGDYIDRKNITDLIIAFNLAFDISDAVSLIIKTGMPGISPNDSNKRIEKEIETIKRKLNINKKYRKEIIITEQLSYKDILGLHNNCDCFIMPSRGESFCRSAAEALILGKTPIVTDNTGMSGYIDSNNGSLIKSHRVPVLLTDRASLGDTDMYTADEYWYQINIYDLIDNMKSAYSMYKTDRKKWQQKKEIGKQQIEQFSYQTIGKKLCI